MPGNTPSPMKKWKLMQRSAHANDAAYAAWKADAKSGIATAPRGFLFSLQYADAGGSCTFQSVGPDST